MIKPIQPISDISTPLIKQVNSKQTPAYSQNELLNLNNQVYYKSPISFGKNEPKLIKEYLKNREKNSQMLT